MRWIHGLYTAPVFAALAAGILVGAACARDAAAQGAAAPPPLPPPAPGQEVPPLTLRGTRYQYVCQTDLEGKIWKPDLVAHLNQMGAEGWRLLPQRKNQENDQYCFERPY